MKYLFLSALLMCGAIAQAQDKPNIVFFMVDDMGWMDTSVPFGDSVQELNKRYHTPNMERLASEGMVFTNAYATPVCTPSRVSLMSGMNVAHHMITNWTAPDKNITSDADNKKYPLTPPDWNINGFSPEKGVEKTAYGTPLPRLIKEAGYYTIHVGKAHFASAGTPGASPYNMGFLVNVAGTMIGMPQSYLGQENYGNLDGKAQYTAVQNMSEYYGTDTFLTEALTSEATKTLEYPIEHKQPFFLYMAHYAVHTPVTSDTRFVTKYLDAGLEDGAASYASMIEGMDKSLGDIMDFLKSRGVEKNTVVIFMADNGGNTTTPQRGGELNQRNRPLRAGKGSVYEGGIREPMIVKWPGVVKPGSRSDQPVIIEDFFPTLLEMTGEQNVKVDQPVDGKSFVSILKGERSGDPDRILTWHYPEKWKKMDMDDIDFLSAARVGDWKLVYRMNGLKLELYNLKDDIGETKDLAAKNPEKVKELAKKMSDKFRAWGTLMPVWKTSGKKVPLPDQISQ